MHTMHTAEQNCSKAAQSVAPTQSEPQKVIVALSGGVDSSVTAALLKDQGYDVVGIMLTLWNVPGKETENRCCTSDALTIAREVAARLDIPFHTIDAKTIFFDSVVKSFIDGYAKNATPNPCLICNQRVRWDFLLNQTLSMGARYLATGHYARLLHKQDGLTLLLRGIDLTKDQSYVLHGLNQHQLAHTLFPLGQLKKTEVRALARQFNLPAADRSDSQDLCFLGDMDYRDFLSRYYPAMHNPGPILSTRGKNLGTHQGLAAYTIGQRKGLNISSPVPLYVLDKDSARNALIVGPLDELGKKELILPEAHWISGSTPDFPFSAQVKIRYKARLEWAQISSTAEGSIRIVFDNLLRDITPGQAAVIYQDDICLGGGIIY